MGCLFETAPVKGCPDFLPFGVPKHFQGVVQEARIFASRQGDAALGAVFLIVYIDQPSAGQITGQGGGGGHGLFPAGGIPKDSRVNPLKSLFSFVKKLDGPGRPLKRFYFDNLKILHRHPGFGRFSLFHYFLKKVCRQNLVHGGFAPKVSFVFPSGGSEGNGARVPR